MEKKRFELVSSYKPAGDQPQAIEKIANGILSGYRDQVILGVTGSGKTFTMANVIEKVQKPTLVIAHNKTLAAQLCSEFREFFPNNAVEYFVSYYDYYQPEAYIASSDTYIAKDSSINDEISLVLQQYHLFAERAGLCDCGGQRVLHLRFGRTGGLLQNEHLTSAGDGRGTGACA